MPNAGFYKDSEALDGGNTFAACLLQLAVNQFLEAECSVIRNGSVWTKRLCIRLLTRGRPVLTTGNTTVAGHRDTR